MSGKRSISCKSMEKIIDPVDVAQLKAELTPDKKLRDTNKGGNELYVVSWHDSPSVVREIGRLREVAFREAGGSSGLSMDLDRFDTMEVPYSQLVVWDPDAEAILGGYRFILGPDVRLREDGQPDLATSHMFRFSKEFIEDYLPHTMELGRSFVAPEYQSSKAGTKALFAMDNLWDGLAAIALLHPRIFYYFGKMTMYPSFDQTARDLILHFLWKHFPDPEELVRPLKPVLPKEDPRLMDLILKDESFKDDYRNLKDAVRRLGTNIPPLVNSYMNASPTMKMLGTAVNEEFSNVEETAIMVCFNEMYDEKLTRHVDSFFRDRFAYFRDRFPYLQSDFYQSFLLRKKDRKESIFSRFKKTRKK